MFFLVDVDFQVVKLLASDRSQDEQTQLLLVVSYGSRNKNNLLTIAAFNIRNTFSETGFSNWVMPLSRRRFIAPLTCKT